PLYQQRLAPLAEHLKARDGLPAARHLIVLPSAALAGVPAEVLVAARPDQAPACTVSYAPSATLFAWLQERREAAKKPSIARLLAIGDPVFATPPRAAKPAPAPPDHGVLLTFVAPGSNAEQSGIRANDVLLSYAGRKLSAPEDLTALLGQKSQKESI